MCLHTCRCVSLCASMLWICLAMEQNTSCKSAPSTSTSSSHWRGSTIRGSWVTWSKDSLSGLYDMISVRLDNVTQNGRSGDKRCSPSAVWIPSRIWVSWDSLGMYLLGKCVQKCLTNACKTNDHVDRFEMSSGGRHMNSKQGVHPSTQEEHLSPLWFIRLRNLAQKRMVGSMLLL